MPEKSETGAELLARIKPQRRETSTNICLRPDLLDAWEDANTALQTQIAEDGEKRRLAGGAGGSPSARQKKLAKDVQDIEVEIEATQVRFVFRSMTKDEHRALCDAYPPRRTHEFDLLAGYDIDGVADASVRKCLVDPTFADCTTAGCEHTDCGTWQQLLTVINPSEWEELRRTVKDVNKGVTDVPKSALAGRVLSSPARDSARRVPSE